MVFSPFSYCCAAVAATVSFLSPENNLAKSSSIGNRSPLLKTGTRFSEVAATLNPLLAFLAAVHNPLSSR